MKRQTISKRSSTETVCGTIVPAHWDNEFRVTGILIACPGEREIRITNLDSFPMLKLLERKVVELTGQVKREGAIETMHIESVRPVSL